MALRHKSVATISSPEFINLEEDAINPGISKCEIKICYVGQNRNGSFFSKDTLSQMANTLPGCPVVGTFRKEDDDFGDHGEKITIENGDISFECTTKPYGFVAPDTKCWFQDFEDEDEFGNDTIHTYLMATGYLWTGQYPELQSVFDDGGKGQSMEVDPKSGHWATDSKNGMDFYIVDDADFLKLCILGDDVEPAFEGAAVTAPEVSTNFSVDDFKKSIYDMMEELKFSLQEGRKDMSNENKEEFEEKDEEQKEDFADKKQDDDNKASGDDASDSKSDDSDDSKADDDKKPFGKNALEEENESLKNSLNDLQAAFNELKDKYEALSEEAGPLREFKASRERADKDALIAKYHMLDDEDKADVIENEDKYSLEEIDSKLALAYVRKNVDFDTVDGKPDTDSDDAMTFSLEETDTNESVDPMVAALREAENY